jgi:hypothetical protein
MTISPQRIKKQPPKRISRGWRKEVRQWQTEIGLNLTFEIIIPQCDMSRNIEQKIYIFWA